MSMPTRDPGSASRSRGGARWRRLALIAVALLPAVPACSVPTAREPAGTEARNVRVRSGPVDYRAATKWRAGERRARWRRLPGGPGVIADQPAGIPARAKLHPALLRRLASGEGGTRELLLVVFRDTLTLPKFPRLAPATLADTTAFAAHRSGTRALVAGIRARRDADYDSLAARLLREHDAVVHGHYWLFRGVRAVLRLDEALALAAEPDVVAIRPRFGGEPPPACEDSAPEAVDARAALGTDALREAGFGSGVIALLDTGVHEDHELLDDALPDGTSRVAARLDFTACGESCCDDPLDADGVCCDVEDDEGDVDLSGHGTASAAILSADETRDDCYRGVTDAAILSYRVYPEDRRDPDAPQMDGFATACAIQAAAAIGVPVVLAEVQAWTSNPDHQTEAIAEAARRAFDTGCVVVAPTGNTASVVASPALMSQVVGVGGWELAWKSTYSAGGRGWVDERPKPDLLGPTNFWTAANGDRSSVSPFGGTSGAAPGVAGAALMARNWLAALGLEDAGATHAWLLASSRPHTTASFDVAEGAGWLDLSAGGWSWQSSLELAAGDEYEIPLDDLSWGDVSEGLAEVGVMEVFADWTMEVVVWWGGDVPDDASTVDTDLSVTMVDGDGVEHAARVPESGVWRRVSIEDPMRKASFHVPPGGCGGSCASEKAFGFGDWRLRIGAPAVAGDRVVAYWVVRIRPPGPD